MPTPTPIPMPTPTPTGSPTLTPTPTPTPTGSPNPSPSPTPTPRGTLSGAATLVGAFGDGVGGDWGMHAMEFDGETLYGLGNRRDGQYLYTSATDSYLFLLSGADARWGRRPLRDGRLPLLAGGGWALRRYRARTRVRSVCRLACHAPLAERAMLRRSAASAGRATAASSSAASARSGNGAPGTSIT